ncbi:hypothetical protein N0M98_05740 [Paenibacillus doosanensis]|uniref:Sugar ABC transporter permease n=1 Tax=Paenibacillus konkukensis TaxID=2020716 RepID=A0ABY4RQE9_9BACL|nr:MULTISPECIES: hypothetical protein [Paenibacillus]MCS7459638.1 hypothetical protein [Paenibacillus doosanensis]UQZ84702.1 hypothetical protein SK3146_03957 [Paenibacillus konkukensis]
METAKNTTQNSFNGLGFIITLFSVIILCPLVYFIINYLLGNERPFYG